MAEVALVISITVIVIAIVAGYYMQREIQQLQTDLLRRRSGGRNVGSPEIHQEIDGGASQFQMDLMGDDHHPRCHHYEWGPCTCKRILERE